MSDEHAARQRARLQVRGLVQGVGFRPFVFTLARRQALGGWVRNGRDGVTIEIEGPPEALAGFGQALVAGAPALARVDRIDSQPVTPQGSTDFRIVPSQADGAQATQVLPDLAPCPECLGELFDPHDRRHRYPFVSCTGCGPRWSIVESLPYDRANTAMRHFPPCPRCAAEAADPDDRRFHAQVHACPDCGPQLTLLAPNGNVHAHRDEALRQAADALRDGAVLALQGLGGFQLLVDARNVDAIARLRQRKRRPHKPLAVMFPDLEAVRAACDTDARSIRALAGPAAPIVLLRHRQRLPDSLAPDNPYLGAMLPATPLHHVLLRDLGFPVVATSGNRSGEPLCCDARDALERLGGLADLFLVHDRLIVNPVDDSVVQIGAGRIQHLRRARGFAPLTLPTGAAPSRTVLAVGGQLKSTVAVVVGDVVTLSPHIGDLGAPRANDRLEQAGQTLAAMLHAEPQTVVHDRHPDYHSTRHAQTLGTPTVGVQHHHAHVVAGMVEHALHDEVLGIAWDGNGYGDDGQLWGGEFLRASRSGYVRLAHLLPLPLPGGARAMREPRRSALGALHVLGPDSQERHGDLAPLRSFATDELGILQHMLARHLNCPLSSAAGRLFDAIASVLGLQQQCSFEGQAAMALQFAAEEADPGDDSTYPFDLATGMRPWILDWRPLLSGLLEDQRAHVPVATIAARCHRTLAAMIAAVAAAAGLPRVVLGGGCFQNRLLLDLTVQRLQAEGLEVFWPDRLPPNDGGLAIGQIGAALAASADAATADPEAARPVRL